MENNIYIGTVKKCKNIYEFQKYGENRYIPDFKIGSIEIGIEKSTVEIIETNAILRKVEDNKYQLIDIFEKEINASILTTIPKKNEDLFIDPKTIKNLSEIEKNKKEKSNRKLIEQEKIKEIEEQNKKECNRNNMSINKLTEKIDILNSYSLEAKLIIISMSSVITLVFILNKCPLWLTEKIVELPQNLLSFPLLITALGTGVITEKIVEITSKMLSKKIENNTNFKNETQRIEQELEYNIEIVKLKSKNVINSKKIEIINKNIPIDSTPSALSKIELEEKNKMLDKVITQRIITQAQEKKSIEWMYNIVIGIMTLVLYKLPYEWFDQQLLQKLNTSLISLTPSVNSAILAFLIGVSTSKLYFIKKNHDTQKAIENITSKLEQNTNSHIETDKTKLKDLIEEISTLEAQIEMDKLEQEIEMKIKEQEEQSKDRVYSIEELTQMKKSIIEYPKNNLREEQNKKTTLNGMQYTKKHKWNIKNRKK